MQGSAHHPHPNDAPVFGQCAGYILCRDTFTPHAHRKRSCFNFLGLDAAEGGDDLGDGERWARVEVLAALAELAGLGGGEGEHGETTIFSERYNSN